MWLLYVKRKMLQNIVVTVVQFSPVHREDFHDGHLRDAIKDLRWYCQWQCSLIV